MGYWATSATGESFVEGDTNPDGTQMLWGDAPADAIDDGVHALIERMHRELGRYPTVEEVDAARSEAPEMLAAIEKAREVFNRDAAEDTPEGEEPLAMTDQELAAGLAFSNTKIALDSYSD